MDIKYTKYFDNCKAVFQGGGCKAIAYIGAYEEAYARGVFFSELAGTSAGAIIAAFIAAGATPQKLKEIVRDIDFKEIVRENVKPNITEKVVLSKLNIKNTGISLKHNVRNQFGLHHMGKLEDLIEKNLQELMGKTQEIRFIDLIPNLHIVSADLCTHTVKVWSKDETPTERVSKAVCASCALPFYFIPVDGRYVDGGLLCNLPNFVFADNAHYNKILSFRFVPGEPKTCISNFEEYFESLTDTIVQGADELHKLLTPNHETYDIQIKVTNIKTADFDKINDKVIETLIQVGKDATCEFFKNERFFSYSKPNRVTKKMHSLEEVHSLVAYLGNDVHEEVIACYRNTKWTWMLFPTILKWCKNQSKITIYCDDEEEDKWGAPRKRMLKAMNIEMREKTKEMCEGFFFKSNNTWKGIVITFANNNKFYAKYYNDTIDNETIRMVISNFAERSQKRSSQPKLRPIETEKVIQLMQTDTLYKDAQFEMREVNIEDLKFMNPFIRALKYKQIDALYDMYKEANLPLFSPATIELSKNKESIVGLPVVEQEGEDLYVIEGNTRLTYAYKHGIKSMYVIVVNGVATPLPCGPIDKFYTLKEILISDKKLEGVDRFGKDWDYSTFRHIESSLRPVETYLIEE
jgi:NTE family protein